MSASTKEPTKYERVGDACDRDWMDRAQKVYQSLRHGEKQKVALEARVTPDRLSKIIHTGSGNVDAVLNVSRAFRIAPPRSLFDEFQWELLAELEEFRKQMEQMFGAESLAGESRSLLRRVRQAIDELVGKGTAKPAAR